MWQSGARQAGRKGPALVLLLLVVAGLFTMHTIGHLGSSHSGSSHGMAPSTQRQASADGGHPMPVAAGFGQNVSTLPDTPGLPLGSIAACVAILVSLTALAVAALLYGRAGSWHTALATLQARVAQPVRGPPGAPFGLLLADLSVARN